MNNNHALSDEEREDAIRDLVLDAKETWEALNWALKNGSIIDDSTMRSFWHSLGKIWDRKCREYDTCEPEGLDDREVDEHETFGGIG